MMDVNIEVILNANPNGAQILNEKGKYSFVNNAFLKLLGRKKDDFIGKAFGDVSPSITSPKESKIISARIKKHLKTGKSISNLEIEIISKDGKKIPVLYSVSVLKDDKGKITGILGVFNKIVEEKQETEKLRESNERFLTYINAFSSRIMIFDKNLNLIEINEKQSDGWGPELKNSIGKNLSEIFQGSIKSRRYDDYLEVMKTGNPLIIEDQVQHPSFGELYYLFKAFKFNDGLGIVAFNITETKKIEKERDQAKRYFDRIFNLSSVMICISGNDAYFKRVNKAFISTLGYTEQELLASSYIDFVHPDDVEATLEVVKKLVEGEKIVKNINRYRCKNGSYKWIEWTSNPVVDDTIIFSVAEDVTELIITNQKLAQKTHALNTRLKELNCLFEVSKLKSIKDLSIEDFVAKTVDLIPAASQYSEITCAKIILDEKEYKTTNFRKSPWCLKANIMILEKNVGSIEVCYLEEKPVLHEGPFRLENKGLISTLARSVAGHITKMKAENELIKYSEKMEEMVDIRTKQFMESEERLYDYINSSTEIFILFDSKLNFKMINEIGLKFYGLTQEEIINRNVSEVIPGINETIRYNDYLNVIQTGSPIVFDTTATINNNEVILNIRAFKVGEGLGLIIRDIADKYLAEEKLRKSEASLSMAQRIAHLGNWDLDMINNNLSWSDETYRIFGLKPQEFTATHEVFMDRVHPNDREFVQQSTDKVWFDNEPYSLEYRILLKDGSERIIHEQAEVIFDEKGEAIRMIGTVQDITDKRLMEEKIARQEKLALLGRLVGGIGHELRNPLGSIKNAAYFLKIAIEDTDPDVKETLMILEKEVVASEKIINNLLGFARSKPLAKMKVNINEIIRMSIKRVKVPSNIKIETHLSKKLPTVYADPDQLIQVFINILNNGIQAIEKTGKLIIKTSKKDSESIVIEITDTGIGISKENHKRLFEPLYTTKAKGIGLGLVLSKAIIEKHEGKIDLTSDVGTGCTVVIDLPTGLSMEE